MTTYQVHQLTQPPLSPGLYFNVWSRSGFVFALTWFGWPALGYWCLRWRKKSAHNGTTMRFEIAWHHSFQGEWEAFLLKRPAHTCESCISIPTHTLDTTAHPMFSFFFLLFSHCCPFEYYHEWDTRYSCCLCMCVCMPLYVCEPLKINWTDWLNKAFLGPRQHD